MHNERQKQGISRRQSSPALSAASNPRQEVVRTMLSNLDPSTTLNFRKRTRDKPCLSRDPGGSTCPLKTHIHLGSWRMTQFVKRVAILPLDCGRWGHFNVMISLRNLIDGVFKAPRDHLRGVVGRGPASWRLEIQNAQKGPFS
jgi:hypothetical protein